MPGSSDLELEVELVDWAELGAVPDMERARRLEIGMRKRERGNKHFTRGDYSTAIQCYRCGHDTAFVSLQKTVFAHCPLQEGCRVS